MWCAQSFVAVIAWFLPTLIRFFTIPSTLSFVNMILAIVIVAFVEYYAESMTTLTWVVASAPIVFYMIFGACLLANIYFEELKHYLH